MLARRNSRLSKPAGDPYTLSPALMLQRLFDFDDMMFGDIASSVLPPEIYNGICHFETDEGIDIVIDLPGVKRENLDVKINDGVLTINATRQARGSESRFSRSWTIDQRRYDPNAIDAHLQDGELTISIAKRGDVKREAIAIEVK